MFNLPPVWTAERVAELRQLASEGFSSGQMGKALGVTRNAIIGKCRREKIPLKNLPFNHPDRPRGRKPRPSRAKPKVNGTAALRAQFDIAATEPADLSSEPITAGEHITGAAAAVFALTNDSCRWPSDDDHTSPDFHFCMATNLGWSPFCRKHHKIAYKPLPVDRQRRAA